MPVNQIIFYQKEEINFNNLNLVCQLAEKLQKKLTVFVEAVPEEDIQKTEEKLKNCNAETEIKVGFELDVVEREKPDLLVITQEKISPLEHVFKITSSERIAKKIDEVNLIMLQEDANQLKKVLINIDRETATTFFIQTAYTFAKKLEVEFDFITCFHETFIEYRLRKTHPEEEAKQLVAELFKEHIEDVEEKIKKALNLPKVKLLVIKGDPKKEIPYFARVKNYDLLIINHNIEERVSYIENSEKSIAIFQDKEEEG
ncbi:MAG: universal stress protein [Aquificae bacterium]|nr:universal stress protein [Aquificota bacterium]